MKDRNTPERKTEFIVRSERLQISNMQEDAHKTPRCLTDAEIRSIALIKESDHSTINDILREGTTLAHVKRCGYCSERFFTLIRTDPLPLLQTLTTLVTEVRPLPLGQVRV